MALLTGLSPRVKHQASFASAVAASVLLIAAESGCHQSTTTVQGGDTTLAAAEGERVVYAVTSNGAITSVSYTDSEGDISTDTNVGDGWTGAARMPTRSAEPTLSAVGDAGTTTLRCSISAGGNVIEAHTSVGSPPVKVTCGTPVTAGATPVGGTPTGPVIETDIVGERDPAPRG